MCCHIGCTLRFVLCQCCECSRHGYRCVEEVVVTDGIIATRTNAKGVYKLKTDNKRSHFVYISVHSSYEVSSKRGFISDFYHSLSEKR
jgi:hypothetical protein